MLGRLRRNEGRAIVTTSTMTRPRVGSPNVAASFLICRSPQSANQETCRHDYRYAITGYGASASEPPNEPELLLLDDEHPHLSLLERDRQACLRFDVGEHRLRVGVLCPRVDAVGRIDDHRAADRVVPGEFLWSALHLAHHRPIDERPQCAEELRQRPRAATRAAVRQRLEGIEIDAILPTTGDRLRAELALRDSDLALLLLERQLHRQPDFLAQDLLQADDELVRLLAVADRSEEHTSELQSLRHLV